MPRIKRVFAKGFALIMTFALMFINCPPSAVAQAAGAVSKARIDIDGNLSALENMNKLIGENYSYGKIITREEFCAAAAKIFLPAGAAESAAGTVLPFADADLLKPEYADYIAALYKAGFLFGSNENGVLCMKPDDPVTRQEAATEFGRLLGKSSDAELTFPDAGEIADYAYAAVAWLNEYGVIVGYPDGTFRPGNNINAGELSYLFINVINFNNRNNVQIKTLIGTGSRGNTDGSLSAARFTLPQGVTAGSAGVYVFDTYNNAVRLVKSGAAVTTVAGSTKEYDAARFSEGGYVDDVISNALLDRPSGGVLNSKGELFVADGGNSVIRFIRGGKMYTFSGTTAGYKDGARDAAMFNNPSALAVDNKDNIYVADTLNDCIRKIDPNGNVTTVAGVPGKEGLVNGAAGAALFREPMGIAVTPDGSAIYVADTGNQVIRKIENGKVTTFAGVLAGYDADGSPLGGYRDGKAASAMFNLPTGITVAGSALVIADSGNNRLRAVCGSGNVVTVAGNGEPGDADGGSLEAELDQPGGVYYYGGTLYIADTVNNKIKTMPFDETLYK